MLSYLFGSKLSKSVKEDEVNSLKDIIVHPSLPKDEVPKGYECFSILFKSLCQEQQTEVLLKMPEKYQLSAFMMMNVDQQNHVFPLLSNYCMQMIVSSLSEKRVKELHNQYNGYMNQKTLVEEQPTNPYGLVFYLESKCQKKIIGNSKISYFLKASELVKYDLQSYKYQRSLISRHIDNIVLGILKSKMMFHPIICVLEDEFNLSILDGQHRFNALKKIPNDVLVDIDVQLDIIPFEKDDTNVMKTYQQINNNVPIDPERMCAELEYVDLVQAIKSYFGQDSFQTFNPRLENYPQAYLVDHHLKREMQVRSILDLYICKKSKYDQILSALDHINSIMKERTDLLSNLTQMDRRVCVKNDMYLGLNFPEALDLLEKAAKAHKV